MGGRLESMTVSAGTNILVAGPPLTGKRQLGQQILQLGMEDGQGAIVISARDTAGRVTELFDSGPDGDEELLGVVDCVTEHVGLSADQTDRIRYAAAPSDMTGMGIAFAEFIEYFLRQHDIQRNRVLLNSVTTLLQYSSLQAVFRFLHALTTRIAEVEALGVAIVESTAHDGETMATVSELFDAVVRTGRDGSVSVDFPDRADDTDVGES